SLSFSLPFPGRFYPFQADLISEYFNDEETFQHIYRTFTNPCHIRGHIINCLSFYCCTLEARLGYSRLVKVTWPHSRRTFPAVCVDRKSTRLNSSHVKIS